MNRKHYEGESNRESGQESAKGGGSGLPPYDFYRAGVADFQGGWFSSLCQFLKDRSNLTVIVIASLIALTLIAVIFIIYGNEVYVKLIGGIVVAAMIFTMGLLALLRRSNGKNTETKQRGAIESGPGQGSTKENGDTKRPDERGESD
jgi:hypothetical protein